MKTENFEISTPDYNLPYERRYWPGMVFDNGSLYKVLSYGEPSKDEFYIARTECVGTVVRQRHYWTPNPDFQSWIVERYQPPPAVTRQFCTSIYSPELDCNLSVGEIPIELCEPGVEAEYYLSYVAPNRVFPSSLDSFVHRPIKFVNFNPYTSGWYTELIKRKSGDVITDNITGKQYKLTRLAVPQPGEQFLTLLGYVITAAKDWKFTQWFVEPYVPESEFKTGYCTRVWSDTHNKFLDCAPIAIRIYNTHKNHTYLGFELDSVNYYVSTRNITQYPQAYKGIEFVGSNPFQIKWFECIKNYRIGDSVRVNGKDYKITDLRIPKENEIFLCLDNYSLYTLRSRGNNGEWSQLILEEQPVKPNFTTTTCIRVWSERHKRYLSCNASQIRVYDKLLPNSTYVCYPGVGMPGTQSVAPITSTREKPRYFDEDRVTVEFVNHNPFLSAWYYTIEKYSIGDVITNPDSKKYKITALRVPTKDDYYYNPVYGSFMNAVCVFQSPYLIAEPLPEEKSEVEKISEKPLSELLESHLYAVRYNALDTIAKYERAIQLKFENAKKGL